jgi:hypothetical protein
LFFGRRFSVPDHESGYKPASRKIYREIWTESVQWIPEQMGQLSLIGDFAQQQTRRKKQQIANHKSQITNIFEFLIEALHYLLLLEKTEFLVVRSESWAAQRVFH